MNSTGTRLCNECNHLLLTLAAEVLLSLELELKNYPTVYWNSLGFWKTTDLSWVAEIGGEVIIEEAGL